MEEMINKRMMPPPTTTSPDSRFLSGTGYPKRSATSHAPMESALIKMFTTAGVISLAAVCAPVINGFRNVPAASCALLGAVFPWLMFAVLYRWPTSGWFALLSFVFIASSFLFAILFYDAEERSARRAIALTAIIIAACAAIYLGVLLGYPLLLSGL